MKRIISHTLILIVLILSKSISVLSFLQKGSRLTAPSPRCMPPSPAKTILNEDGSKDDLRLLDATFLVSGTTIGAGMLALPEVAREPGFIPSTLTLVGCWVFMSITGLLIAEVAANLSVRGVNFESGRREDRDRDRDRDGDRDGDADLALKPKGILAMVDSTLGRPAALASGATYLFFHYTLLCAYISEAGLILNESLFHSPDSKFGSLIFTAVLGYILFFGSENFIGKFNDVSLLVVILSFIGLVCILSSLFSSDQLLTVNEFVYIPKAVPIMFLALVYHNVVPVICEKLKYDKKSITKAILFGTFIPLFMFVIWIGLILGIKLPEVDGSNLDVMTKVDPVMLLKMKNPGNEFLGPLVSLFSEFSISTSFTGFVLGLTSFFKDILPSRREDVPDPYVYNLILLPPLVVSLLGGSDLFLSALDIAGTYGITFLFGVLPVFMVQSLRY